MPPDARRRRDRHQEVLGRWPVLAEEWARAVEAARLGERPASPATEPREIITPLEAINRALGIADDDGVDAIERARASEEPVHGGWRTSGG